MSAPAEPLDVTVPAGPKRPAARTRMRLINRTPSPLNGLVLGAIPFVLVLAIYAVASEMRRAENPADKLLPSLESFADAINRLAFEPDPRKGVEGGGPSSAPDPSRDEVACN